MIKNRFEESNHPESENDDQGSTFRLRLALSGILFVLVLLFDLTGKKFAGISTEQLFQSISVDYGTMVENWLETINLEQASKVL